MHRIALRSLAHDRGKLLASLAGVAFASTLLLAQVGLYVGFLQTSSALIANARGDLWVMARGTEVLDNGETLSAGSKAVIAAHPCVQRVRGIIMGFAVIRKAGGALDTVQVIGFEPGVGPVFPWSLVRGLPSDLHGPLRVAVDGYDMRKLQIWGDPLGAALEVNGQTVHVAAITEGIRSFTLLPYMFAEIDTARRLVNMAEGQAQYWVVDLKDRGCLADVVEAVGKRKDLQARTTDEFRRKTEEYWVADSGAGTALGFSALLGLIVGVVVVGQTLYAITEEHIRELGTLKAIGATNVELVAFVGWQAAFLWLAGGGIGALFAWAVKELVWDFGLVLVLSPGVLVFGIGAIAAMCVLASLWSVRKVLKLEAAEVFK
jgi:putative ABC transport system permease protein